MMGLLKRTMVDEKGASSVLVVFMMLVLITLGALAITSANVNYKLSRRTLEWNAMYYGLDEKGEEFLFALDGKLAKAESMAYDYVKNKGYQYAERPGVSQEVQTGIFDLYTENDLTDKAALDRIYMYYADMFVTELSLDFSELQVHSLYEGDFIGYILAEISFQSELPNHEFCGLNVSVSMEPLEYEVSADGEGFSPVRPSNDLRYKIEDWYEYQKSLSEEEPADELWDGSLLE